MNGSFDPPTVYTVIAGIGLAAVVLTPWNEEESLSRLWCVHEIGVAAQPSCRTVVILLEDEEKNFLGILGYNRKQIMQDLCKVKVKQCKTSEEEDRGTVHRFIEEDGVGRLRTTRM